MPDYQSSEAITATPDPRCPECGHGEYIHWTPPGAPQQWCCREVNCACKRTKSRPDPRAEAERLRQIRAKLDGAKAALRDDELDIWNPAHYPTWYDIEWLLEALTAREQERDDWRAGFHHAEIEQRKAEQELDTLRAQLQAETRLRLEDAAAHLDELEHLRAQLTTAQEQEEKT